MPQTIPCEKCDGCYMARTSAWAIRCTHESWLHDQNSFITLTYEEKHLPFNSTLVLEDFQEFMKRLRKNSKKKIRVFYCGEYGLKNERPHYHALIFGMDFSEDRYKWRRSKSGYTIYRSPFLERTWEYGFSEIGEVSFQSAAYIARYIFKKVKGELSEDHYYGREEEFCHMSNRNGIGILWLEQNWKTVFTYNHINIEGKKFNPPKAYKRWFEANHPTLYRTYRSLTRTDNEAARLEGDNYKINAREDILHHKLKLLIRGYEK